MRDTQCIHSVYMNLNLIMYLYMNLNMYMIMNLSMIMYMCADAWSAKCRRPEKNV